MPKKNIRERMREGWIQKERRWNGSGSNPQTETLLTIL
jgi:hypothetical protein